ncbi:Esterase TesA OS=Afipia felis OX=1035 GN=tesA PE=4 SV=1 [Afipia felis]
MKGWALGIVTAAALVACAAQVTEVNAAEVNIVALGASNTFGSGRGRTNGGVPSSQAIRRSFRRCSRQKV